MPEIQCFTEKWERISEEIKEVLYKDAIVEIEISKKLFKKKGGGWRPVINLISLNTFVRKYVAFQM